MRMKVITKAGTGDTIVLPEELALDDHDTGKDVPGVVIPGKAGRRKYGHLRRLESKQLRASGTLEEYSRQEAESLARYLRSVLVGQGELWLFADENDERYIKVEATRVNTNLHRGHFRARVFTLTITFTADDPFWYALHETEVHMPAITTSSIEVENSGTHAVDPLITLSNTTGTDLVDPQIVNTTTGRTCKYAGTVAPGEELVINTEERTAELNGNDVTGSMSKDFLINGFPLEPGDNVISFARTSGAELTFTRASNAYYYEED